MKSTEINAIYAAKISEFLNAGYQINTNTMNGSQGEIAKIDFRKGNEVIRVMLHQETIWGDNFRTAEAIVLTVGRCDDERVINARGFGRDAIIWNERLDVIEKRIFFKIGSRRDADWYLEGEEGEAAMEKYYSRLRAKYDLERVEEARIRTKDITSDEVRKILLPAVRRHLGKPNMKMNRIAKVTRSWNDNRFEYTVITVGKNRVVLH